jgi:hypothetical protein
MLINPKKKYRNVGNISMKNKLYVKNKFDLNKGGVKNQDVQ